MERGRSQTTLTRRGRLVALQIYIFALVYRAGGYFICSSYNPIPTNQGWNQPLYERHVTKSGRNRDKKSTVHLAYEAKKLLNTTKIAHENSTFNFSINTFFATVRLIEQYAKW
jgi:hypothetical protein